VVVSCKINRQTVSQTNTMLIKTEDLSIRVLASRPYMALSVVLCAAGIPLHDVDAMLRPAQVDQRSHRPHTGRLSPRPAARRQGPRHRQIGRWRRAAAAAQHLRPPAGGSDASGRPRRALGVRHQLLCLPGAVYSRSKRRLVSAQVVMCITFSANRMKAQSSR
jgi:hypothetical protein